MVQILQVIHALRDRKAPFDQLVDNDVRIRLTEVFNKGIECILNTQIVVNGKLQSGVNKMSIFRRGTRIIIINCNVWAYGNDVPSLWVPESNGMYYHTDLFLRCPEVDFICPRGWRYIHISIAPAVPYYIA